MSNFNFSSTPAALTLAEAYTKATRVIIGDTVTFTYPEGIVTYERTNNEYVGFPVAYEFDVKDAISAVAAMNPAMFDGIKVYGKVINEMTIFVVISEKKSRDDVQVAQGFIARQLGGATIPFSVKGDISLDDDFLAEEEDVYADGIAACIEEPAPINPELEEAYTALEKAEMELAADPTSRSKARKVMMLQNRVAELGGEV